MANETRQHTRKRIRPTRRVVKAKHFRRLLEYYLKRRGLNKRATLEALRGLFKIPDQEKILFTWVVTEKADSNPCCTQWPYLCDANCQTQSTDSPFGE